MRYSILFFNSFLFILSIIFVAAPFHSAFSDASHNPIVLKKVPGFKNPESVIYDQKRDVYYVSQANFEVPKGGGLIGRLKADGSLDRADFVKGLNHPKGIGIVGDKLYIADVERFVEVDANSGNILKIYPLAGAKFLNDIAVGPDGTVYITDMLSNFIATFKDGQLKIWLQDEKLHFPNGIKVIGDELYISTWGTNKGKTVDDLLKANPDGILIKVALKDKKITPLSKAVGHLDGLEPDENGNLLISDWVSGKLYSFKKDGTIVKSWDMAKVLKVKSAKGFADIFYSPKTRQMIAPMMMDGTVIQFSMKGTLARGSDK